MYNLRLGLFKKRVPIVQESCKKSGGFSLIEVMFALFLVSLALAVFAVSMSLSGLVKNAKNQNIAYHIAINEIEELRRTAFSSLPASGNLTNSELGLLPNGSASLLMSDVGTGLKRVTVTVSWEGTNGAKNVTLDSLIYEKGLNTL